MQYNLQTVWTYTRRLDGTWCNGRRNVLTGNNPEKVSNEQKTKPKSNKQDQGGGAEKPY